MRSIRLTLFAALLIGSALISAPTGVDARPSLASARCAPGATVNGISPSHLAPATASFGFSLLHALLSHNARTNTVISPSSISLILAMAADGARGTTATALQTTLGLQGLDQEAMRRQAAGLLHAFAQADPRARLVIANSIWTHQGARFQPSFLQDAHAYFGARTQVLDFRSPSAPTAINTWVNCATSGAIPNIVNRIPPDVIMYLLNAVYFKARWSTPFDPRSTTARPFTTADGSEMQVPLMHHTGRFAYVQGPDFQAAGLPYGGGRFALDLIVPRPGVSLVSLVAQLQPTWKRWVSRMQPQEGLVALPRFNTSSDLDLRRPLATLGMAPASSSAADFSGLCRVPARCRISQVRHRSLLRIDEAGTVAAAVTSVGVSPTAMAPQQFQITADHPFLLAIRDTQTGALLFLGAISDPLH